MIDALFALCMLSLGIFAMLVYFPIGWKSSGETDMRGRATAIMHARLEWAQDLLINPCHTVSEGVYPKRVYSTNESVMTANAGDRPLYVETTVRQVNILPPAWNIVVKVTWDGNSNGVTSNRMVLQQEAYRFPLSSDEQYTCSGGLTNVTDKL
jgi:hypothetical protein